MHANPQRNIEKQKSAHDTQGEEILKSIDSYIYLKLGDRMPFPYFKAMRRMANDYFRNIAGQTILDLGCGAGYWSVWLARQGGWVASTDISHSLLKVATRLREENLVEDRMQPAVADCSHLPFRPETFDKVFGMAILHHLALEEEERALQQVHRVLKPGGLAVFFETLKNSEAIDTVRKWIPVVDRPSSLSTKWKEYVERETHPPRPYTSQHYRQACGMFSEVTMREEGIFNRLDRFFTIRHEGILRVIHEIDSFISPLVPFRRSFCRNVIIVCRK